MSAKQVSKARALCSFCPVRRDCLAFALTQPEHWGIWGGLTAAERKRSILAAQEGVQRETGELLRPTHLQKVAWVIAAYDAGNLEEKVIKR